MLLFSISSPVMANSAFAASESTMEQMESEAKCYVNGQNVRIQNAGGQIMEVYNVTGVRVLSFRIDSEDKSVNLSLPKGIYLIKVGKFVRKISIR